MSNTSEFLVDQAQNVNLQGPLVTMTTPNFINTVNALNQIV